VIDEERNKRKNLNNRKAQDLYGNIMNKDVVHGFNEQDAFILQQLVEGTDDKIKQEHKQIQTKLFLLEHQINKLV
jgi:hypothetical protein